MEQNPQTSIQEAISFIVILAILIGLGCYVAALQNVPILASFLLWVATQVYHFVPSLYRLPGQQIPMLVSAATVGVLVFLLTIPFAALLAQMLSPGGLQSIERQTSILQRQRKRIKARKRDKDDFRIT